MLPLVQFHVKSLFWHLAPAEGDPLAFVSFYTFPLCSLICFGELWYQYDAFSSVVLFVLNWHKYGLLLNGEDLMFPCPSNIYFICAATCPPPSFCWIDCCCHLLGKCNGNVKCTDIRRGWNIKNFWVVTYLLQFITAVSGLLEVLPEEAI